MHWWNVVTMDPTVQKNNNNKTAQKGKMLKIRLKGNFWSFVRLCPVCLFSKVTFTGLSLLDIILWAIKTQCLVTFCWIYCINKLLTRKRKFTDVRVMRNRGKYVQHWNFSDIFAALTWLYDSRMVSTNGKIWQLH